MCRYAMTLYKLHYACFDCRKSFKRRLLIDIQGGISQKDESNPAKCPECGKVMADMGLDFKSPKKTDIKSLKHISNLYKIGITFHSCGCNGPWYIPDNSNELTNYLNRIRSTYLQHQRFWTERKEDPATQNEISKDEFKNGSFLFSTPKEARSGTRNKPAYDSTKAQIYWSNRIAEIDQKLELVKNSIMPGS